MNKIMIGSRRAVFLMTGCFIFMGVSCNLARADNVQSNTTMQELPVMGQAVLESGTSSSTNNANMMHDRNLSAMETTNTSFSDNANAMHDRNLSMMESTNTNSINNANAMHDHNLSMMESTNSDSTASQK